MLRIARTTYDSSNLIVEFAVSATRPGYPIETIMERGPDPEPPGHANGVVSSTGDSS